MDQSIAPGVLPPVPGLEKEEPELAYEEDIPSDDGGEPPPGENQARDDEPLRETEHE